MQAPCSASELLHEGQYSPWPSLSNGTESHVSGGLELWHRLEPCVSHQPGLQGAYLASELYSVVPIPPGPAVPQVLTLHRADPFHRLDPEGQSG